VPAWAVALGHDRGRRWGGRRGCDSRRLHQAIAGEAGHVVAACTLGETRGAEHVEHGSARHPAEREAEAENPEVQTHEFRPIVASLPTSKAKRRCTKGLRYLLPWKGIP